MAFKLCIFAAFLVIAQAGALPYKAPYHDGPMDGTAETQEHVVRNSAGTVATQSKALHTPYASVHKQDTRITHNNNHYNKHTTNQAESDYSSYEPYNYHAHAHEEHTTTKVPLTTYHHETAAIQQEAPAYHHHGSSEYHHEAPTYHHETPSYHHETLAYHPEEPAYHHEAPAYHQVSTTTASPAYYHGPAAHTYNQNDHAISEHGANQKVHYSPANMVSHMSFEGFGTHWGF